jgi:hypothetical protein
VTDELPLPPDPLGKVIILIREFIAERGDLTDSGSLDFTDVVIRDAESEKGDEPPYVLIGRMPISPFPFGAGSGRMGVADHTFSVRCYGRLKASGEREAAKLSGLVFAALHNRRGLVMGSVAIHRIRVLSTGPVLRDPVMKFPYVPMTVGLYASSLEVAS